MSIIYDETNRLLAFNEVALDILKGAKTELYLSMRFLDVALASLVPSPDGRMAPAGTDGALFYYQPDALAVLFRGGRIRVNRLYLHCILHCIFAHLWLRRDRDAEYWNLACDVAVEAVIDDLTCRCVRVPPSTLRRGLYRAIREEAPKAPLNAQRIYRYLTKLHPTQAMLDELKREFSVCDHALWEQDQNRKTPSPQQKRWEDIRDAMQTELETFGKDSAEDAKALEEQVCAANRKRYDYRRFLRKFSVLKEEMQVDPDSYDYIFYNYGMELYGNLPLIEPLETKEVKKIEDFVLVLDTSMSCKGELLKKFLEETYSILSESESFFRKIHLHILQCDDKVQEDVLISNREQMEDYLQHFTVRGFGGTDFRPPFHRVRELLCRGCFTRLKGLIYFTDGYGTFPTKKPPYETAFVFLKEDYRDVDVPPWAIKLIVEEEELTS